MKQTNIVTSVVLPVEEYDRLIALQPKKIKPNNNNTLYEEKVEKHICNTQTNHDKNTHMKKKRKKKLRKNIADIKLTPKISPKIAILTKLRAERRKKIHELIKKHQPLDKKQIILNNITVNKRKIEKIIDWLLNNQKIISWNKNHELVLYGTPIPDTNILLIFRNLYKFKEDPNKISGAVAFYSALREVDIPEDMILNEFGKQLLKKKKNNDD